ncbi:hypothetical protein VNO80_27632 [Phaseolus coccineus]|uniref:Uncharacterized protein n=1 Tax=Phaseolus coccineus TaxID=3886 RepID=A0AAN9LLJ9_PHACN
MESMCEARHLFYALKIWVPLLFGLPWLIFPSPTLPLFAPPIPDKLGSIRGFLKRSISMHRSHISPGIMKLFPHSSFSAYFFLLCILDELDMDILGYSHSKRMKEAVGKLSCKVFCVPLIYAHTKSLFHKDPSAYQLQEVKTYEEERSRMEIENSGDVRE